MLIFPGGGYILLSPREEDPAAFPFFAAGYQVFILEYSVGEGIRKVSPESEAAAAVALLREHEGVTLWQDGLLQLFQYLQENRAVCLCALHSISREHLKRFFQTDVHAIIQGTIQRVVAELNCRVSDTEVDLLTKFYVGALASMMEEWLLENIQETPEELIRFADQLLKDHVRGAALRMAEPHPAAEQTCREET